MINKLVINTFANIPAVHGLYDVAARYTTRLSVNSFLKRLGN